MTALSIFLIALGVSDLLGGLLRRTGAWRRWAPVAGGVVMVVLAGAVAGASDAGMIALLVIAAAGTALWQLSAATSFASNRRHWLPLALLAGTTTVLIVFSGHDTAAGGPLQRWLTWSDLGVIADMAPERLLLILGLVLVQVSTANVLVRLALSHVGAMRPTGPQPSDRLRGGRLLGPMERLVILGLGLAGQLTAASLVIAAKGLIRWPELQKTSAARPGVPFAEKDEVTIDSVTEYFLVGSFISWVIALGGVAVFLVAGS